MLREAQPAKAAQAKLEAEFLKREKDLTAQGEALKAASEKFEREAPTLSESQRVTRQRALVDQDRDFQRRRREFQEDLNARKNEELQQVYERANRVVKQVAEAEKYDAILQEAIYINPKHDITEKVIKALNASHFCRRQVAPRTGVALRLGAIVEALGGELQGDPALSIERPGAAGDRAGRRAQLSEHPQVPQGTGCLAGRLRHRVARHAGAGGTTRRVHRGRDPYLYFARLPSSGSNLMPGRTARASTRARSSTPTRSRPQRPHRRAVRGRARRPHRRATPC